MSKNICFIHSTTMNITGTYILDLLLSYMNNRGKLFMFENVVITNIGTPLDEQKYAMYPNVIIINFSEDLSLFENATMKQVIYFSKMNPDYNVMYLHTKGVSYSMDHPFYPGIMSWIHYMLYCLVDHASNCTTLLQVHDTIGCNIKEHDENPLHYSGNFWWARSSYLRKLQISIFREKYDCEFMTLSQNPKWFNVYTLPHMYELTYHPMVYQGNVNHSFIMELAKHGLLS